MYTGASNYPQKFVIRPVRIMDGKHIQAGNSYWLEDFESKRANEPLWPESIWDGKTKTYIKPVDVGQLTPEELVYYLTFATDRYLLEDFLPAIRHIYNAARGLGLRIEGAPTFKRTEIYSEEGELIGEEWVLSLSFYNGQEKVFYVYAILDPVRRVVERIAHTSGWQFWKVVGAFC